MPLLQFGKGLYSTTECFVSDSQKRKSQLHSKVNNSTFPRYWWCLCAKIRKRIQKVIKASRNTVRQKAKYQASNSILSSRLHIKTVARCLELGYSKDSLRLKEQPKDERAPSMLRSTLSCLPLNLLLPLWLFGYS